MNTVPIQAVWRQAPVSCRLKNKTFHWQPRRTSIMVAMPRSTPRPFPTRQSLRSPSSFEYTWPMNSDLPTGAVPLGY